MSLQAKADWIAVDWGTTNLRIWALDSSGQQLLHRSSDKGMGGLAGTDFEPALLELISDLLSPGAVTPVIVCGMAGSRQGWAEAPYKTVPCTPPSLEDATTVQANDPRLDVRILPGIKQLDPPDVMRGEETQISGFLAANPEYSGTLCLPGTHTKWGAVENGRVEHFRTFMTGEMFALLSGRSVLRHSLSAQETDQAAFEQAVTDAAARPQAVAANLFGIRAAGLVADLSKEAARGRLSGYLIGSELAAVRDGFDLGAVTLLGSDQISRAYQSALSRLGFQATLLNAETITLNGLVLAYSSYSRGSS
jgi:2-dehydro-3-deoxygalactonokinase